MRTLFKTYGMWPFFANPPPPSQPFVTFWQTPSHPLTGYVVSECPQICDQAIQRSKVPMRNQNCPKSSKFSFSMVLLAGDAAINSSPSHQSPDGYCLLMGQPQMVLRGRGLIITLENNQHLSTSLAICVHSGRRQGWVCGHHTVDIN